MRRAREREMDANQCNGVFPTKFYTKVMEIPVVQFGVHHATGIYGKVKDFNKITHKSFELAESVTGAVVGRVTPLAHKGISMAGPFPHKIDDMAANSLEKLENNVSYIKKAPDAMVSDVKSTMTEVIFATKDRVTNACEGVLVSKPVQTYFDVLEFMLSKVQSTLDIVLPEDHHEGLTTTNGHSDYPTPDRRADRGWWLLGQFFGLLGSTKNRVFKRVRTRIDKTSHAADAVFNEAKKAVSHALPVANDKDAPSNGESVPPCANANANANKHKSEKKRNKNGAET